MNSVRNSQGFAAANVNAKLLRAVTTLVRRARLDYEDFRRLCVQVRRNLDLCRQPRSRKLPHLVTEADLKRFYDMIDQAGNLQHQIMLRLLFYTAVRVSELTSIKVEDVDLNGCRIFIEQGKGAKDRYILFPESFRLVLRSHLQANPKNRYLFESQRCTPFTPRRVQQIVQGYRDRAGIAQHVHPHLFRHQMLTFLTAQGLSDAQIQLISGHESKRSLEVYQHLSLETVEEAYQEVMKSVGV